MHRCCFTYTISIIAFVLLMPVLGYTTETTDELTHISQEEAINSNDLSTTIKDEPFITIIEEAVEKPAQRELKESKPATSPQGKINKSKPLNPKDLKDNNDAILILYNKIIELEEQLQQNTNRQEINQKKIQDLEIKVQNLEAVLQLLQSDMQERKKEKFIKEISADKNRINTTKTYPKSGIAIYNKLTAGKINEAELELKKFIKDNPKSSFIPEASYYLGEIFFYYEDYPAAVRYFVAYYKESEKGIKAPNALVKMTLSFSAMEKKQETCLTAEKVLSTYNLKMETKEKILEVAKKNACTISNINPKKTP